MAIIVLDRVKRWLLAVLAMLGREEGLRVALRASGAVAERPRRF